MWRQKLSEREAQLYGIPMPRWLPWLDLVPWASVVLIFLADMLTGESVELDAALVAPPALAAVFGRNAWLPLPVGVVSVLAYVSLGLVHHHGEAQWIGDLRTNAGLSAIVVVTLISWVLGAARLRLQKRVADVSLVAEVTQRVLLRPLPPKIGPVRVSVRYVAAMEHARIGGDLYEVVLTRHGVRAIIGDVRGKGLLTVETAASVLGSFRDAAHEEETLRALAGRLSRSVERVLGPEDFVTAALVAVRDGELDTLVLGHPPPLLLTRPPGERDEWRVEALEPADPAPPLGVVIDEEAQLSVVTRRWEPGNRLLLYTDGTTEARDRRGEFYPLVERIGRSARLPCERVLDDLLGDVQRHLGHKGHDDDAALLLLEYDPTGGGSSPRPAH
ncbi:PP2C family protein-serine/threonine phosphatase [Allostreptomyces psammosilenae]|uniref:PPM-type phosphatase domain-containing protein n=1 Tax=Allostreptomyces psammosilenae TaxID=1892865 RepID=A0A852ZZ34_9ACTN|nr:PP2C family protein-serine/threonine phosphatase [Allostreptomyces psammosilenae]NYI07643.1 hypothetical protein [Allostreptomyces psammosilenae]